MDIFSKYIDAMWKPRNLVYKLEVESPYPFPTTIVIYEGLYFNLAQGQMNGAPNETRTHSCRFASLTC